jgi:hypothetical protein
VTAVAYPRIMSQDASDTAERAARKAASHPALRMLARTGYAANGVVHILIGAIVLAIAAGGSGESDQSGAFTAIAEAPLGFVVLWVLAAGLVALGLWYVVEGVLADGDDARKRWGRRVGEWVKAIVYIALGVSAATVALGSRPDGDQSAQSASGAVLAMPGGPFILGVAGAAIVIVGGAFVVKGATRSFREKLSMPGGTAARAITALGVVGYVAKGIALVIVGILVITAAVTLDPDAAGGFDEAISSLIALPFGPWLVASVGVGFIAYGLYCFFRARYARL